VSQGKGSSRRPTTVPKSVVDANYDRIFPPKEKS